LVHNIILKSKFYYSPCLKASPSKRENFILVPFLEGEKTIGINLGGVFKK